MFEYENYIIVTEPDYMEILEKGRKCDEYWCSVYDKNDVELEHCLCGFNMMCGFEFDICTKESIETGIKKLVVFLSSKIVTLLSKIFLKNSAFIPRSA